MSAWQEKASQIKQERKVFLEEVGETAWCVLGTKMVRMFRRLRVRIEVSHATNTEMNEKWCLPKNTKYSSWSFWSLQWKIETNTARQGGLLVCLSGWSQPDFPYVAPLNRYVRNCLSASVLFAGLLFWTSQLWAVHSNPDIPLASPTQHI